MQRQSQICAVLIEDVLLSGKRLEKSMFALAMGAEFDSSGKVLKGPATKPLTTT